MDELQRDPAFAAAAEEREATGRSNLAQYERVAAPALRELEAAGYPVRTIGELRRAHVRYPGAIRILLHWLPRISDRYVLEDLVRTLSVPWAGPTAALALIDAFRSLPTEADPTGTGLRWAIGNALEVLASKDVLDNLIELAMDRRYGPARQMVVLGLARPKDPRVVQQLIELLDDKEVAGHAAMALKRLRAREARDALEALLERTTDTWVRKEAQRALARIDTARR